MTFKAYDILSSLVPGFLALLVILNITDTEYDKDLIIPYTAIAFLLGYLFNTISSWMEEVYFFTWGGKPSSRLLDGKGVWKVRFYQSNQVKALLSSECSANACNDELFAAAMKHANLQKDTRIEDLNSNYAFSRSILTTVLVGSIFLLVENYSDWRYYAVIIPVLLLVWLRAKQRAYYYAKEVLNTYLKFKNS